MWLDYCQDLATCRLDEIEIAIREYRLNVKEKFFPKSAQLREIVFANRKHRQETMRRGGAPVAEFFDSEVGDVRPGNWWMQSPYLWRSHWRESDIPPAYRASFKARLAAKRRAGAEGWGVNDFYGFERKSS